MRVVRSVYALVALVGLGGPLGAATLTMDLSQVPDGVGDALRAASLTQGAVANAASTPQDILAATQADYGRLLAALYDAGYYSGQISIRIDGREAAGIQPLDAPAAIGAVTIRVNAGREFRFGEVLVAPLADDTTVTPAFRAGEVAQLGAIKQAARDGVDGWRAKGYAKAKATDQSITADHGLAVLDARILLDQGPRLRFGQLSMRGYKRMRPERLAEIAGYPTGKWFSPERLNEVRARLRRSGVFSSVSVAESETISAQNTLDATLSVAEAPLHRIGYGGELSSLDGLNLSGFWLHRNMWGGGERLRFDASVSGIGVGNSGPDFSLGSRLERPATFTPDTSAVLEAEIYKTGEDDYDARGYRLGFGLEHVFNPRLTGGVSVEYARSTVDDISGETLYSSLALPITATWDNRDNALDAHKGYYGNLVLTPFVGFGATGTGGQIKGDFRAYRAVGDHFVLAGRLQFGTILGSDLAQTPRDYLFYSGGGGSVRGQPYHALDVTLLDGGTVATGGTQYLGFSTELRGRITDTIGMVAFYDAGFVGADYGGATEENWHAGAGLGLRYMTGIGPLRLDVAGPVGGDTGGGVQLYLGIGQAF